METFQAIKWENISKFIVESMNIFTCAWFFFQFQCFAMNCRWLGGTRITAAHFKAWTVLGNKKWIQKMFVTFLQNQWGCEFFFLSSIATPICNKDKESCTTFNKNFQLVIPKERQPTLLYFSNNWQFDNVNKYVFEKC